MLLRRQPIVARVLSLLGVDQLIIPGAAGLPATSEAAASNLLVL